MPTTYVAVRSVAECLLLQWRPLVNESAYFIICDEDGDDDCCSFLKSDDLDL